MSHANLAQNGPSVITREPHHAEPNREGGPPFSILLVTPFSLAAVGGVSTAVRMLHRQFRAAGHNVTVFLPGERNGIARIGADPEIVAHGAYLRSPYVPYARLRGLIAFCVLFPLTTYRLARFLRERRFDIIAGQYPAPWLLYFALLRPFSRWKFVLTFHGNDAHDLAAWSKIERLILRVILARADHVVGVSGSLIREVRAAFPRLACSTSVVPSGAPIDQDASGPAHLCEGLPTEYMITVGQLISRKGVDLLIQAVRLLHDRGIRASLLVVGDGPERPKLVELARTLHLENAVVFVGNQPHATVMQLIRRSLMFVLASRAEGLPLVVVEAMAGGVAVVATNVDGLPELIEDGVNGLLVRPEDPSSLADAVARLYADPELRRRLNAAGHRRVLKDYTWNAVARAYLAIFEKLRGDNLPGAAARATKAMKTM